MKFPKKARDILLIILAFLFFLTVYFAHVRKDMTDFGVCYKGGQRILKGETLYRLSDGHLQYKYSPPSALFFSLLALLPYEIAKFIWYLSQLFFFFLILLLSYDLLPSKQKRRGTVLIFSFLILVKFFGREIELGQVNILILFLLFMMVKATLEEKEVKSGLFWSIPLLFKPYAFVFLPYFILKKKLKLLVSGSGVLVLGFIFPVVFYGFRGNLLALKEWQRTLSLSTSSLLDQYDNASLYALFLKNLPSAQKGLAWIFAIFIILLIGFFFLWMMLLGKKKNLNKPEILEFSYLFILIPLFSPLAWYYNYLYSVLAVVLLINIIDKFPPVLRYALIANFIIIAASIMEVMGRSAFRFYTRHSLVVISFLIILFSLFYSRLKSYS